MLEGAAYRAVEADFQRRYDAFSFTPQGSSQNALIDARCPLSGASGDGGATIPFFGGRGDACGGGRLLR